MMMLLAAGPASGQSITTYRHIILDGHEVKWGSPTAGTGAVVTYAILDAAYAFSNARNCRAMAPIAPLLAASGLSVEAFKLVVKARPRGSACAPIRMSADPTVLACTNRMSAAALHSAKAAPS
jgi:hypothetical protein